MKSKTKQSKSDVQSVVAVALGELLGRVIDRYFPPDLPPPNLIQWPESPPPAPEAPDPYRLLGLKRGCIAADVRRRVRQLAGVFHPDREAGDAEKMAEINAAADAILAELEAKR
jgi:DnaJ-class molecular chaperone